MTVKYLVDGVVQTDSPTLVKGKSDGLESAADGSAGTGEVIVRDPTGVLAFEPWAEWAIEEDGADVVRSWTGHAVNVNVSRGDYTVDPGRIHTIELFDLNGLLKRQALEYLDINKRPAETGDARMAWLLASRALAGIVYDNGRVASNPWNFDEADYRGKYADDVLNDISVSSVDDDLGMLSYVYWDPDAPAGNEYSLAYYAAAAAPATSSISLSNVASEVNNTDTFWIHPDPQLTQAGEDIYCGVFFTTKNGTIYRHSAATHAAFFAGKPHRDGQFSTDRIGLGDTANRHALAWLANHAGVIDTLRLTARLSVAAVNSLQAGTRVSVHIPHLPGYATAVLLPVRRRTYPVTEGRRVWYDIPLELSLKGIAAIGGGSPGNFPTPPAVAPGITQQASGASSITFTAAAAAGDTLVFAGNARGAVATTWPYTADGYSLVVVATQTGPAGGDQSIVVYKTAVGGETVLNMVNGSVSGTWYELPGAWTPGTTNTGTGAGAPAFTGALTVPASTIVVTASAYAQGGAADVFANAGLMSTTPGTGWTEDYDHWTTAGGTPISWTAHQFPAAGSVTGSSANIRGVADQDGVGTANWAAVIASFTGPTTTPLPVPGQWVYGEVVTMTTVGGVSTGTTANVYAAGSLKPRVRVDGVLISPASVVETGAALTPATGAFALTWIIDSDETVTVDYQGI